MTARRIDRILMALGGLLILISAGQLFFSNQNSNSGAALAKLTSALSVVKTKNALSLEWRDASIGNDLTENQLIYTDNSSSAEVLFNQGHSLEIGENSLVRLRSLGTDEGMDVSQGFIRAKLHEDTPLKIQVNGEDYVLVGNNADVQINVQDEKGQIGVLSGDVKVTADGVAENINSEVALEIEGQKVSKKNIYFKAIAPANSSTMYSSNNNFEVSFSWTPEKDATVVLSKNRNFTNQVVVEGGSGVTTTLGEGLWYYKIESDEGTSLVNSFRLVQEKAPQIIRPGMGEEISLLEGEEHTVLLQWKGDKKQRYLVEWKNGILNEVLATSPSVIVNVDAQKSFSWRVKLVDENRPETVWSEWQEVDLKLIPLPKIPEGLIPHEVEYQTYETPNEKIDLLWKGEGIFDLEVKTPNNSIHTEKVSQSFTTFHAKEAGLYQWRVRSGDSFLRKSDWSGWKTFTVQDLSQEKSSDGVQRIQLKKPDQAVTFAWDSEKGATNLFELSRDASFKEVVRKVEVTENQAKVNVPVMGTYYWRSRQYLPDGTLHVSEPKRVIIEPVPAPEKPLKLPNIEVPLKDMPLETSVLKRIFDFIIPSAVANDIPGMVHIELPVKEEAKAYVVRIYEDEELKNKIFESEINSRELLWKGARPGVYYWQYAIVDFWDRRSLFSDPSVLTVKADPTPLPDKPRLLSPIGAKEIEVKDLVFNWTHSEKNSSYWLEISPDRNFNKILYSLESKVPSADLRNEKFENQLHFWRVHAFNKRRKEVLSNIGRFNVIPSMEKTIIEDIPKVPAWKKSWNSRGFLSWVTSLDNYTFSDGESGTISGTALMGLSLSGTVFKERFIFNGEVIRQTGKVFEGESYLYQRILFDAIYTFSTNNDHRWGAGIAVGQTSGGAYKISDDGVTSESVSGPSYGPLLRNYYSINKDWEVETRLQYLLGEVKEMELGANLIHHYRSWLLLGGLNYSTREYEISSGKQTSIRVLFGLGNEF